MIKLTNNLFDRVDLIQKEIHEMIDIIVKYRPPTKWWEFKKRRNLHMNIHNIALYTKLAEIELRLENLDEE